MINVDVGAAQAFGKKSMWAKMEEAMISGDYRLPRKEGSWHITTQAGVVHTIMTRVAEVDATDPVELTRAEINGREQALEYARFLRDHVPGYEDAALSWIVGPHRREGDAAGLRALPPDARGLFGGAQV